MIRKTKFALEMLGDKIFAGYTQGEDWNGFACPYFTFEQAQLLVKAYIQSGGRAWYEIELDAFCFEVNTDEGGKIVDSYLPEEIERKKVYPIGAFCWRWEENNEAQVTY